MESKNKHKMLLQLLQQPRRYFSAKELSFRTGMSAKRVKTQLSVLSKQRLVLHAEKSKLRFYKINQHAASFEELRKLFAPELKSRSRSKTKDLIERVLYAAGEVKFAALSGVFIGLPKSQVDLLLVGDVSPRRSERTLQILQRLTGIELNYALFTEKEFRNRLYSFDWFVKEIMERDPLILIDRIHTQEHSMRPERYIRTVFSKVQS